MRSVRVLAFLVMACTVTGVPLARAVTRGTAPTLAAPAQSPKPTPKLMTDDLRRHRAVRPASVTDVDNAQFIDINNIKMFITNTGSFAWDKTSGNAGLEYPKGTGKTCVFAAGLWMGGQVGGVTHIAVSEYSDEYGPGAMVGGATDDPGKNKPEYHVYKLYKNYTDTAVRDADLASYNAGAVIHGAPAVAVQGDGSLNILGDEFMWAVYNDADPTNHTNRAGSTAPLGIEVQQSTFAFNRQGPLGNTVFIQYKMINKGSNTINNMYVSQWSDPDDGYAGDDLDGCDTTLSVGYVYNGTNNDNVYGTAVPCVGYDFFQGPKVGGVPLPMTSFNKYINGTDPDNFAKTYNLMKGLQQDGSPLINPTNGQVTTFMLSGDPVLGTGWLDTNPADRRLQCSSGPFTMVPGDTQVVTTAIIVGQSKNRLASISLMKFEDSEAQAAFDANFNLPSPPTQPVVVATPLDGGVRLTWDISSESYNQPPYNWEGYVVYQGASVAGPWTRLGTFDRINGITTVLDNDFNEEQGLILPIGKAFGTDAGVQYSLDVTADAVRGGPLHNGTTYFFSVDAYAVGIGSTPQVLESAFNVIPVVPQTPPGGVDLGSVGVSALTQGQHVAGPPPTTDVVSVNTIDPNQMVTASYLVGFKPTCATCSERVWYLVRTQGTAVDTVINNWSDFVADQQNQVVDGIQVTVLSYPLGQLANVAYVDTAGGAPQGLDGAVGRGLRFFNGASDYGGEYPGSSLPSFGSYDNCEIRFGPPSQKAYWYVRAAAGDTITGFVDVPFTAWDLDTGKQLNVAFREQGGTALQDGIWDPNSSSNGGREPFWIMGSAYTGVSNPGTDPYFSDPTLFDMLGSGGSFLDLRYEVYPRLTSASAVLDPGDKILFQTSIPANSNDYFTFTTTGANRFNASIAKSELNRVLAVPNPYFNHSTYELNQFGRVVKFTHLPAQCTLRIFNLAGDLVRTMQKNDNTSQISWDLLTDKGLPVASGIYLFHVDAPNVGTKTGKVAIFMEKERLNTY
jgi:hypothetical protein